MGNLFNYSESLGAKLSQWKDEEQPKNKLLSKGLFSPSDAELLAVLIRTGTKELNCLDLARALLSKFDNSLNNLARVSVADILAAKIPGIGASQAAAILSAMELGRRKYTEERKENKITSSRDIYEHLRPLIGDLHHEEFYILCLSRKNIITKQIKMSSGGITGTVADVRMIFKEAIQCNCVNLIISHNHPSGNNKPSGEDIHLTKKVKDAANLFDITLLDHVIIAGENYYSFADEGML